MAIESRRRRAPARERSRPIGRLRPPVNGRRTVAGVLVLVAVMGVLGAILGFASQAFVIVEVGGIVLMLVAAVRLDPGRYRYSRRHGAQRERKAGERPSDRS